MPIIGSVSGELAAPAGGEGTLKPGRGMATARIEAQSYAKRIVEKAPKNQSGAAVAARAFLSPWDRRRAEAAAPIPSWCPRTERARRRCPAAPLRAGRCSHRLAAWDRLAAKFPKFLSGRADGTRSRPPQGASPAAPADRGPTRHARPEGAGIPAEGCAPNPRETVGASVRRKPGIDSTTYADAAGHDVRRTPRRTLVRRRRARRRNYARASPVRYAARLRCSEATA